MDSMGSIGCDDSLMESFFGALQFEPVGRPRC
jgi:hypothetical protein